LFKKRNLKVLLTAPTGRASKRLAETTGEEAKTIHRLLQFQHKAIGGLTFYFNESNPIEADVVIVDEISMVDTFIFNALLKALPDGTKLILVGDKDQLPSVSPGNILADIIDSQSISVIKLSNIYRQESGSLIIENAYRINNNIMPITYDLEKQFALFNVNTDEEIPRALLESFTYLSKQCENESDDIQTLSPLKKSEVGVERINELLQSWFNPNPDENITYGIKSGDTVFRQGDRVMQTVNNYDIDWVRPNGEKGVGIFNGEIGYIIEVDYSANELSVQFDESRICRYNKIDLLQLSLAYAVTIHKSQGSEFSAIIILVPRSATFFFTRKILYTAVTRAKRSVALIGNKAIIERVVRQVRNDERYTLLKELIWDDNSKRSK
ncbi:MAG: AAA family ATPase, partial [Christensenellaceae bacterium]|nr:AAA family ATPase [Christensenellaceae bacterium]